MSKEECLVADWYTIGLEDGSDGKTVSNISKHRKACADAGVTPDIKQYTKGLIKGLQEYCIAARGYQVAMKGDSYQGVCRGPMEKGFLQGYKSGQLVYNAKKAVSAIKVDINLAESDIRTLTKKIAKKEAVIIADESTSQERSDALKRVKSLNLELSKVEVELHELQHIHDAKAIEYEVIANKYANSFY